MSKFGKIFGNAALKVFKGFVLEKDTDPLAIDHSTIKTILIVIRHQMGDMLCSLPMMRSLRDFYPEAKIILITKDSTNFENIFKDNSSPVNEIRKYEYGFESFLNITKELKDMRPDLAIVPSSVNFSATNHLLAYFSNAKYRAGVKSRDYEVNRSGYVLNIKNDFLWDLKKVHQMERNLDVIRQLNIKPACNTIQLSVNDECSEFAEKFIAENFPDKSRIIIGFHTGAGKEQNVWASEKYAALVIKLGKKYNPYFYFSKGPADEKCVTELESLLKGNVEYKIQESSSGILKNGAILSKMSLFISNDTGIMHLVSGFNIPQIGLFGPTKAWEWGIIGENKVSIQSANENINNISLEQVLETSIALLSV
ncbi:MAG: glycosyltransferase family 9 protein [Ignavibacteria bacterium]|nr:glycosyltransferase family 9 protein [Ignavibacteria bacterium]